MKALRRLDPDRAAQIAQWVLERLNLLSPPGVQTPEGLAGFTPCGECAAPLPPLYGAYWRWGTFGSLPTGFCTTSDACLPLQGVIITNPWPPSGPEAEGFSGNSNIAVLKQNAYTYVGAPPPVGSLRAQNVMGWIRMKNPGHPYDIEYIPPRYIPMEDPDNMPYPPWWRNLPYVRPLEVPETPIGPKPYPEPVRRSLPDVIPDWYEVGPRKHNRPGKRPGVRPGTSPAADPGVGPSVGRDPAQRPDELPSPGKDPGTRPEPDPAAETAPQGALIPLEALTLADAQLEVEAGFKSGKLRKSSHRTQPPGKGVKEKKSMVVFGPGGAGKVYGMVTEAQDVIKCFYNALPKKVRNQRRGQHLTGPNMVSDVWDNWDSLDVRKATQCLVLNEITDRAIGKANQAGLREWRNYLGNACPIRTPDLVS